MKFKNLLSVMCFVMLLRITDDVVAVFTKYMKI